MFNFYLITDTHLWDPEALGENNRMDMQCVTESAKILDAAFDVLAKKEDSDIVLIAGDLTNNGERANHEAMVRKLRSLKERGKRVFVITATHDYGLKPIDDDGNVIDCGDGVTRAELRQMYDEFGFADAIAVDEASMSYVAQLADGYRLLCLNDDGNGRSFCGYYEKQLDWILEQIKKAKEDGQFIFAMTHHPLYPPFAIYPYVSRRDMLGDYEKTARLLADAGVRFIFTGHTHAQNIGYYETAKGNRIYDINTGALPAYPAPIRHVTVDDENMTVVTERLKSFDWDLGGKTVEEYMGDRFDSMLNKIFYTMEHDFDEFAGSLGGISVERSRVEPFRKIVPVIGAYINKLDFEKLGKLLLMKKAVTPELGRRNVRDFLIEAVRNMWCGNEIYGPDTDEGKFILALGKRLQPIAAPFIKKAGIESLPDFLLSLIYDPTPDGDAVLPLH